jgi:hypothetical protein
MGPDLMQTSIVNGLIKLQQQREREGILLLFFYQKIWAPKPKPKNVKGECPVVVLCMSLLLFLLGLHTVIDVPSSVALVIVSMEGEGIVALCCPRM